MNDEGLLEGAASIASDLIGPGGPIKLAKIVHRHLAWFAFAEARGMTWAQMAVVLFDSGATRANGTAFTIGHLSSCVWRARRAAKSAMGTVAGQSVDATPVLPESSKSQPEKNPIQPRARMHSAPHVHESRSVFASAKKSTATPRADLEHAREIMKRASAARRV